MHTHTALGCSHTYSAVIRATVIGMPTPREVLFSPNLTWTTDTYPEQTFVRLFSQLSFYLNVVLFIFVVQGLGLSLKMGTPYIGKFLSHQTTDVRFDL